MFKTTQPCSSTCCTIIIVLLTVMFVYRRVESVEKVSGVEKRYEPLPQISPSSQYGPPGSAVPPNALLKLSPNDGKLCLLKCENTRVAQRRRLSDCVSLQPLPANCIPEPLSSPKPELPALRPASRDEPAPGGYPPPRGLPEKSPVNGTDAAPPKTLGAPPPASYNRYVPKPYTSSARPFERKFESPKFNHNLLPNDTPVKTELPSKSAVVSNSSGRPALSPQPPDHDSGLDTFTRTMDNRPKYQHNNINAIPKAVPVR